MPPPHQLQVLFETSLDAVYAVDDERRLLHASEPGAALLGVPADAVPGRRVAEFCPPSYLTRLDSVWEEFQRAGRHSGTWAVRRADGTLTSVRYGMGRDFARGLHLVVAREIAGPANIGGALTRREHEVLQLSANGLAASAIAAALGVSGGTVKTHFQNMYAKLGVHDRAAAVATALRRGLID